MQWSLLPTLLHVAVAVIFIAGLIGRKPNDLGEFESGTRHKCLQV